MTSLIVDIICLPREIARSALSNTAAVVHVQGGALSRLRDCSFLLMRSPGRAWRIAKRVDWRDGTRQDDAFDVSGDLDAPRVIAGIRASADEVAREYFGQVVQVTMNPERNPDIFLAELRRQLPFGGVQQPAPSTLH